ncbi:hypothetical protein B0I35DRAFT_495371 [Stachybotrys elegans]|uniref:FAD-binding PCMH-type domain-containing protein n=1 Tax=Stachybotrys elegans TaxID=80388 RepID=A0A8K0SHX9_9HYPO|nr:hypothetical protein B0I35DRAFT_495371 [Stachybotrys elegans]
MVKVACGICCLALSRQLPGRVFGPGDSEYSHSLASYYSAQGAATYPSCIVSPLTTLEVSTAVQVLSTGGGDAAKSLPACKFAIRSGGHATFAGASNIDGGVTIDLSGLTGIELLSAPTPLSLAPGTTPPPIVSVGVGSRWGSVYDYLDDLHLSVNGGRAAGVGVAGLTLGGGISYFGPRFGWTCDTVKNYEVVLGNGTIVNANDNENANLLWALRGGGNNIGIVTRIDLETFPQEELWGGQVVTMFDTVDEQIAALAAFNDPGTYDEFASLITTFAYSADLGIQVVVNNMEYTKPVEDPPVFHPLLSIPALTSTQRIANITDLTRETEANNPNGLRHSTWLTASWGYRQGSATLTIQSTVPAIKATVDAWEASLPSIQGIPGLLWGLGMDPLPPQLYAVHSDSSALGLTNRNDTALIVIHLTMTWLNAADDNIIDEAAKALVTAIKRETGALDALDPYIYVNYAAPWQRPIESYGQESVERLRRVRSEYDPAGVFTNLVSGGFKIPG